MEQQDSENVELSIIIVNYGAFDLIENCLASLQVHTKNIWYEIIVVQNGGIIDQLNKALFEDIPIKWIINENNRGFAAANNQAFKLAKGEYVLLLNNDTIFFENTIGKSVVFLRSNPQYSILGCKLLNANETLQESFFQFPTLFNLFSNTFLLHKIFKNSSKFNKYYLSEVKITSPTEVDVVSGAFILCKSNEFQKLDGFDERFFFYGEEIDLCKRLKNAGGRVIYYPLSAIYHLGGATTSKNLQFKCKNQAIAYIKFYQKHFKSSQLPVAIFLHYIGIFMRCFYFLLLGFITISSNKLNESKCYFHQLFIYPKNLFKL